MGVQITTGGNPTLRRNRIHDEKVAGVFVYKNGQGTLEDNEIFANVNVGVQITTGGNPTLRRNQVSKNHMAIVVLEGGQGVIEDNDLRGNVLGAWLITQDCKKNVKLSGNRRFSALGGDEP